MAWGGGGGVIFSLSAPLLDAYTFKGISQLCEVFGSAQLPWRVRFRSNSQYKLSLLTSVVLLSNSLVIPERHS
jgi:hypothetical protein